MLRPVRLLALAAAIPNAAAVSTLEPPVDRAIACRARAFDIKPDPHDGHKHVSYSIAIRPSTAPIDQTDDAFGAPKERNEEPILVAVVQNGNNSPVCFVQNLRLSKIAFRCQLGNTHSITLAYYLAHVRVANAQLVDLELRSQLLAELVVCV